ncbi:MAG: SpoIVB peptidase [Eubacteriaceae bacterium]
MRIKLNRKKISLFFICFIFFVLTMSIILENLLIPNELYLLSGKKNVLKYDLPLKINISSDNNEILQVNGNISDNYDVDLNNPVVFESESSGSVDLKLKLFGLLPADIKVKILPNIKLFPGGQLVGVKLETKGVIVVGLQELLAVDNTKYNPANDAELLVGDIIYKINNIEVNTADEVTNLINDLTEEPLKLYVQRKSEKKVIKIKPIQCKSDDKYRIGVWVRDNTAGIGTMTFYQEETLIFGALGHAITDITTSITIPVKDGSLVSSKVLSILPGKSGKPGEIRGVFYNEKEKLGQLINNSEFGIFGQLSEPLNNGIYTEPIEIGLQNDVKIGPAKILTTLDNDEVAEFDIYIEKKNLQSKQSGKGMTIKVTDKRLLEETGGIIQGMSGSPIIQDGKLIGAVTHVFVNDPTKGYGVFIEWMIEESRIRFVEK